ncbi:MAG: lactonase family protein [Rikenellaceae bacterium]|nr:lactonase family protein [Rikenellaceae bacterium]
MKEGISYAGGFLLIGTYTDSGKSDGVYVYSFDATDGVGRYRGSAKVTDPSYITLDNQQRHLYCVSEGTAPSLVNALRFDAASGGLDPIDSIETRQEGLCNIIVSPDGGYIVTSNYGSGSLSVFEIPADGSAGPEIQTVKFTGSGPVAKRQEASHIHCARFCRCGKYIFITDLGGDAIYRYNVSPGSGKYLDEATLRVFKMEPGSGPRHFVFDNEGRFFYLANELTASVTVFSFVKGEISPIQELAASRNGTGDGGDIKISPDGRYVCMSVRENGDDGIAIYRRDFRTGLLEAAGYRTTVEHPRSIEFSPDGRYLLAAGMKADAVQVFECTERGSLRDTGTRIDVPSPTCLIFTK